MMDEGGIAKETDIVQLSFDFATKIVAAVSTLPRTSAGMELGRQLLRAGTSIGANVEEAQGARTKPEFINSMNIAKREARETRYWLRLMSTARVFKDGLAHSLVQEAESLVRILTSIVKTAEARRMTHLSSIIKHPAPQEAV